MEPVQRRSFMLVYVNGMNCGEEEPEDEINQLKGSTGIDTDFLFNDATPNLFRLFVDVFSRKLEAKKQKVAERLHERVIKHLKTYKYVGIVGHSQGGDVALKMAEQLETTSELYQHIFIILLGSVRGESIHNNNISVHDIQNRRDVASIGASLTYYHASNRNSNKVNGVCFDLFCHSSMTYLLDEEVRNKILDATSEFLEKKGSINIGDSYGVCFADFDVIDITPNDFYSESESSESAPGVCFNTRNNVRS